MPDDMVAQYVSWGHIPWLNGYQIWAETIIWLGAGNGIPRPGRAER